MTTTALQIEMWTLDRVRPYENNPRNNDKAVDAVAASSRIWLLAANCCRQ